MAGRLVRVLLDTNILVSATIYNGKQRQILSLVLENKIRAIISPILLTELLEVLNKKFPISSKDINLLEKQIKDKFAIVHPRKVFSIVNDEPDNRVLEAAVEGKCQYIVTGDIELLNLKRFRNVQIIDTNQFLKIIEQI